MFGDMAQLKSNHGNKVHMRLQGALNSPAIDWLGDVTVIPQGHGEVLLVSLLVDQDTLRCFLDQFLNLNLTILPIECSGNGNLQRIDRDDGAEGESQWISDDNSILKHIQVAAEEA